MLAHDLPTSILTTIATLHIIFFPIAAGLLAFLTYLYFAHPRKVSSTSIATPKCHHLRPPSFLPLLIAAVFTQMLSHVLNAMYISQSLPRSSNLDLHIPSLTFTPWLVLMTSATLVQHFPVPLLVITILITLRERYHALLRRVNEKGDWVPGPFLGWVGKEGTSMMITYMLFFLPIASRLTLSLGLAFNDSPYFLFVSTTTETADFSSWNRMFDLALVFENCRVLFFGIAVFDIVVSSYCLYKEGGFWGVSDRITAANLHLVAPLLTIQAVHAIVSSFFVSATRPGISTLSSLDLASTSIVSVTTYLIIALLTFLFCKPGRWNPEVIPDATVVRLGPIHLSENDSNTLVSGEYIETPKSVLFRHTV